MCVIFFENEPPCLSIFALNVSLCYGSHSIFFTSSAKLKIFIFEYHILDDSWHLAGFFVYCIIIQLILGWVMVLQSTSKWNDIH